MDIHHLTEGGWLTSAVLFGLVAAGVTIIALASLAIWRAWTRRQAGWFAAFAAGALISIAFMHLLPEAFSASVLAPGLLLAGFIGAYCFDSGLHALGGGNKPGAAASAVMPLIAIAAHSFVDGIAYAVTFSVDFETGALTALGLIFHEVPEAIIIFTLLQRSGLSNAPAFALSFLGAGLTTPLGALAAGPFLGDITEEFLGQLFAVTAGGLLFIGTSHLLPNIGHEPMRIKVPAILLGSLIGVVTSFFHGHDEHHDHDHDAYLRALDGRVERLI